MRNTEYFVIFLSDFMLIILQMRAPHLEIYVHSDAIVQGIIISVTVKGVVLKTDN